MFDYFKQLFAQVTTQLLYLCLQLVGYSLSTPGSWPVDTVLLQKASLHSQLAHLPALHNFADPDLGYPCTNTGDEPADRSHPRVCCDDPRVLHRP